MPKNQAVSGKRPHNSTEKAANNTPWLHMAGSTQQPTPKPDARVLQQQLLEAAAQVAAAQQQQQQEQQRHAAQVENLQQQLRFGGGVRASVQQGHGGVRDSWSSAISSSSTG